MNAWKINPLNIFLKIPKYAINIECFWRYRYIEVIRFEKSYRLINIFQASQNTIDNNNYLSGHQVFMNKSSRSNRSGAESPTMDEIKLGNYRYRESDILGYGFESIVYKGRHASKNFEVAIKAVNTSNLKEGINKVHFENQIKCLQILKCTPHILNLLQKIEIKDKVYLITELCTGDLSDQIDTVLSEEQIWEYMKQLSKGFMYLWKENIIHRDIKPKNLFINARHDIKYGDFGFAIKQSQLSKQKKYNVGSPAYMSPQAFKYNQYSHASDIWAIGIIFYQMWTGHLPWNCSTEQQLQKRMNDTFIQNFIKKGQFDERSKILLRKLLKVNPKERMTAEELMQFFNEKKKQDLFQHIKNKGSYQASTSTQDAESQDAPLQLQSPLWQFKKKKQISPTTKFSGFSITLKSAEEKVQQTDENQQDTSSQMLNINKFKSENFSHRFEKKKMRLEPQSALPKNPLKKNATELYSPNPRAKKLTPPHHTSSPDFVMKYLMGLAENCFDLFSEMQSYEGGESIWVQHFPLLKVCYKNLIIRTTSQIMNIQTNSKFLSQFCSTLDIKDYIYDKKYEQAKQECEQLIDYFKENEELNLFWPKAKQNNFLGTLNATISFIEALQPHLKDNMKVQLSMALTGSLIARKIALYLSSSLNTLQNDNDDSATIKLNTVKVSGKINEAIQLRKNLLD